MQSQNTILEKRIQSYSEKEIVEQLHFLILQRQFYALKEIINENLAQICENNKTLCENKKTITDQQNLISELQRNSSVKKQEQIKKLTARYNEIVNINSHLHQQLDLILEQEYKNQDTIELLLTANTQLQNLVKVSQTNELQVAEQHAMFKTLMYANQRQMQKKIDKYKQQHNTTSHQYSNE